MPTINWFILSFLQIQNKRTSNIAEEAVINDEDVDAENAVPDLYITKLIDPLRTRINHENYNLHLVWEERHMSQRKRCMK